jgi:hypothetical protein
MRGKIKYVTRYEVYRESTKDHWRSDVHPFRETGTYAVLYNEDTIDIDEDEIRTYFGCQRLTRNTIQRLSDALHNKWVEYDNGALIDSLEDII